MVQEIAPAVFSNAYTPCTPDAQSRAAVFQGESLLVSDDGCEMPLVSEMAEGKEKLTYLFSIDAVRYYLAPETCRLPGYSVRSLFELRQKAPRKELFAAYTAYHLNRWYSRNRFCGRCGGKTVHDAKLRMLYCPACGLQIFPTISPAVIIGVTDGERLLLSRYARGSYSHYALLAGFTEIG